MSSIFSILWNDRFGLEESDKPDEFVSPSHLQAWDAAQLTGDGNESCARRNLGVFVRTLNRSRMMADNYIHLIAKGDVIVVSGMPAFFGGHKIPAATNGASDGIFAEWRWDGSRLRVRTCRYGFYPLFYFVGSGEICVATSIPKLIAEGASTELDEAAMAVFLRLGSFVGEDTPFRAIRALPPNANLEWENNKIRLTGGIAMARRLDMDRDDAIEAYVALFRKAVQRRAPKGKFALPLSGGKDSRHILFELCAAGYVPESCVTLRHFPPRTDDDAKVAAALAQRMGIRHVVLEQNNSRVRAELRKNVLTSFCADEHAWLLPLVDYLDGRTETTYDGIAGDFLSDGVDQDPWKLSLFRAGDFSRLANNYLDHFLEWHGSEEGLEFLLQPESYRRFNRNLARERVAEELTKHAEAPNPTMSFTFWNRCRRKIACIPYSMIPASITVFSPYLDHELYDLLASLPPEMVLAHKFHEAAIFRAFPEHSEVRFERTDARAPHNREDSMRFARELACYTLSRKKTSHLINYSFLLPRLAQCARDGERRNIDWLSPIFALYLVQLEQATTETIFNAHDEDAFDELAGVDLDTFERRAATRFRALGHGVDLLAGAKEDPRKARWLERQNAAVHEILSIIPPGDAFILVDEGLWDPRSLPERRVLPFFDRDGQYWGPPPDDEAAMRELESLRDRGAHFIVFAWTAFWWLNFYTGLAEYLRSNCRTVLDNNLLIVFELRLHETIEAAGSR